MTNNNKISVAIRLIYTWLSTKHDLSTVKISEHDLCTDKISEHDLCTWTKNLI